MRLPEALQQATPELKPQRNERFAKKLFGGFCIRHGYCYSGNNCGHCVGEQTTICEFVERWTSPGSFR
jgi:hypothetical protein